MEDTDAQLQLKKRSRRRLVGAVAFVALVAVVLPMIMDHEPRQVVQDVEIRIPGQDDKPFAPRFAAAPPEDSAPASVASRLQESPPQKPVEDTRSREPAEPAPHPLPEKAERLVEKSADKAPEKHVEKLPEKRPEKVTEKVPEKAADKVAEKAGAKPSQRTEDADAKRAASILAGKASEPAAVKAGGEHVVLIGAFSNEANVKVLRNKLGELGIKAYTESLDSPQGKKTRVRAGPFANREAAESALEKMRKVGISGVVAARQ